MVSIARCSSSTPAILLTASLILSSHGARAAGRPSTLNRLQNPEMSHNRNPDLHSQHEATGIHGVLRESHHRSSRRALLDITSDQLFQALSASFMNSASGSTGSSSNTGSTGQSLPSPTPKPSALSQYDTSANSFFGTNRFLSPPPTTQQFIPQQTQQSPTPPNTQQFTFQSSGFFSSEWE